MIEMVLVPEGFYIGKYLVTQELWEAIMGANPSSFKDKKKPVDSVSWLDCIHFCNKLSEREGLEPVYTIYGEMVSCNWKNNGYRLPTEQEWIGAARGSEGYQYAGSDDIDEVGWYAENSGNKTHRCGQKKPNGYGIYDMSGNLFEWCWEEFEGREGHRILHGGAWYFYGEGASIEHRESCPIDARHSFMGLRLASSLI